MDLRKFISEVFKGFMLCLLGGLLFWSVEHLIYIISGATFSSGIFFRALLIYGSISAGLGLLLSVIFSILYKFEKKWIEKINIPAIFSAFLIVSFSYFYIKFLGLIPFMIDKLFPEPPSILISILIEIGIFIFILVDFILLYLWLRYADKKGKSIPLYIALTLSFYALIISGIYINNFYNTLTNTRSFLTINGVLLAGAALFLGVFYIFIEFIINIKKAAQYSMARKLLFLASFIILIALVLFLYLEYFSYNTASSKKTNIKQRTHNNVILITIDTLRADHLGCYGNNKIITPHIDSLADSGIIFEKTISQSPWTMASISSILTSLYPSTHKAGEVNWEAREKAFRGMSLSMVTLTEILHKNNYLTGAIVTNAYLTENNGYAQGFDSFVNLDYPPSTLALFYFHFKKAAEEWLYAPADAVTNEAIKWVEENSEEQFFLWIHYMDPHWPYHPPVKYKKLNKINDENIKNYKGKLLNRELIDDWGHLVRSGIFNLNREDKNYMEFLYNSEICFVDEQVGKLLYRLKDLVLFDNSIIIVVSDHGEEFWEHDSWEHGHTLYNELLNVPLIIHFGKEYTWQNKKIKEQVRLIDIFPTILEALEIEYSGPVHGKSLIPLMLGDESENRLAISEFMYFYEEKKALNDSFHKYIYYTDTEKQELYNLETDPAEQMDISNEYQDMVGKKHDQLMNIITRAQKLSTILIGKKDEALPMLDEAQKKKLKALGYIQG